MKRKVEDLAKDVFNIKYGNIPGEICIHNIKGECEIHDEPCNLYLLDHDFHCRSFEAKPKTK